MKDALGAVQRVLVLGGTSDIGLAIARRLATPRDARVVLAGRDQDRLAVAVKDLVSHGVRDVTPARFDALDLADHHARLREMFERHGGFDVVLVAFGLLGDQSRADTDAAHAIDIAMTNYVGALSAGTECARLLAEQGHGALVFLSSVAGERARRSNFVYGSSKAGLDAFAQGLGDRHRDDGVHVLVVRPGFVHTKMTDGLKPAPLSTTPEAVAEVVERGLRDGRRIVWAPPALHFVMIVLRHLPHAAFRRLPL